MPDSIKILDVLCPPDFVLGAPMGAKDGDAFNKYLTYIRGSKKSLQRLDWWSELHH